MANTTNVKYIQDSSGVDHNIDATYLDGKELSYFATAKDMEDNEEVTSAALNDLNNRCDNTLTLDSTQELTSIEKNNVLNKLGIADETLNLTIECNEPSRVVGVNITISYDNNIYQYIYQGQQLSIVIPMFSQYTVSFSSVSGYYTPESFTLLAKRSLVRNITVSYDTAQYTDLSLRDINGNTLTKRNTANCYVIKSTGYYELPLVYGNGISNDETNTSSYTQIEGVSTQPFYNYLNKQITSPFIETDTNISAESADIVYSDVSTSSFNISGVKLVQRNLCKYLRFDVNNFPSTGGNAVLCVKDGSGQIMWSWHIWAYGDTLSTISHTNNTSKTYKMLNVNLGWVKEGEKYGTCPHYQWGRKDPMLRPANSSSSTNATVGYGSWTTSAVAPSVASAIQNPNVFNKQEDTRYNWWQKDGSPVDFYNYWDASQTTTGNADKTVVKTVYDPCPAGYAIPCGNTFTGFSTENGGTWDKGWTWDGRYFPASGYRDRTSGGLNNVGSGGDYWLASSHSQSYSYYLGFYSGNVSPQDNDERAYGLSVCPVAVQELI